MKKARFLSVLCGLSLILSLLPLPAAAAGNTSFSDVKSGDWFYPYVTELAALKGASGYEDGTFRPNGTITRAEVAAMALGVFPVDDMLKGQFGGGRIAELERDAQEANGDYWANPYITRATLCGILAWDCDKTLWSQPATRAEIAHILVMVYMVNKEYDQEIEIPSKAPQLIGDYYTEVVSSPYQGEVCWMYSQGIISGVNERGDFKPGASATRAECCTMLVSLLHPEKWKQIDWDKVAGGAENGSRLDDGVDFKGKKRIHYSNDVAYSFCRELEEEIGIQIFYLPEWTPKEAGLLQYSDMEQFSMDGEYFNYVLMELSTMKTAYDLYPEGFLKEVAQKKGKRDVEIILCPYTFPGVQSYGVHVYDYSNDAGKVDQIYYTGMGDAQYYSHEMGHMVMSSAAILNGWNSTCSAWEGLSTGPASYVSAYAMTSRPEDWAETWAYLWHQTDRVVSGCSDPGLRAKVQYMSQILDKGYSTFRAGQAPWASVLN